MKIPALTARTSNGHPNLPADANVPRREVMAKNCATVSSMISRDGFTRIDQTGRLSRKRGRGFHVAMEIDIADTFQRVGRHEARVMDGFRPFRLQRADTR